MSYIDDNNIVTFDDCTLNSNSDIYKVKQLLNQCKNELAELKNKTNEIIEENKKLKAQLDYEQKWATFINNHWNELVKEILPKGWYCMASDGWSGTDEEAAECISRLHRMGVQTIIKKS